MLFVSRGIHKSKMVFGFEFEIKQSNVSRGTKNKIMISGDEFEIKNKKENVSRRI